MQRRTALGAALAAVAAMSGCASSGVMRRRTTDYEVPKLPEPGQAMVYVVRPAAAMTATRFKVFLDNQEPSSEKGTTGGKQFIYFSVTPGTHTVYSKADKWSEIEVTAGEGEVVFIEQKALLGGFLSTRSILRMVEKLTGTFQVKSSSLGTFPKTRK